MPENPPREDHTCPDCGLVYTQLQGSERDDCPRCGVRRMADEGVGDRFGVASSAEWGACG